MLERLLNDESDRDAALRASATCALRAVAPDLTEERIHRLILAQRPASAAATLEWLKHRAAAGESLDDLPEATGQPFQANLARDLAARIGCNPDEIQDLVDYVWFHPRALKQLTHAERISLIRTSLRISFHNPSAVAQVALENL
jgi:hypothetical protein